MKKSESSLAKKLIVAIRKYGPLEIQEAYNILKRDYPKDPYISKLGMKDMHSVFASSLDLYVKHGEVSYIPIVTSNGFRGNLYFYDGNMEDAAEKADRLTMYMKCNGDFTAFRKDRKFAKVLSSVIHLSAYKNKFTWKDVLESYEKEYGNLDVDIVRFVRYLMERKILRKLGKVKEKDRISNLYEMASKPIDAKFIFYWKVRPNIVRLCQRLGLDYMAIRDFIKNLAFCKPNENGERILTEYDFYLPKESELTSNKIDKMYETIKKEKRRHLEFVDDMFHEINEWTGLGLSPSAHSKLDIADDGTLYIKLIEVK